MEARAEPMDLEENATISGDCGDSQTQIEITRLEEFPRIDFKGKLDFFMAASSNGLASQPNQTDLPNGPVQRLSQPLVSSASVGASSTKEDSEMHSHCLQQTHNRFHSGTAANHTPALQHRVANHQKFSNQCFPSAAIVQLPTSDDSDSSIQENMEYSGQKDYIRNNQKLWNSSAKPNSRGTPMEKAIADGLKSIEKAIAEALITLGERMDSRLKVIEERMASLVKDDSNTKLSPLTSQLNWEQTRIQGSLQLAIPRTIQLFQHVESSKADLTNELMESKIKTPEDIKRIKKTITETLNKIQQCAVRSWFPQVDPPYDEAFQAVDKVHVLISEKIVLVKSKTILSGHFARSFYTSLEYDIHRVLNQYCWFSDAESQSSSASSIQRDPQGTSTIDPVSAPSKGSPPPPSQQTAHIILRAYDSKMAEILPEIQQAVSASPQLTVSSTASKSDSSSLRSECGIPPDTPCILINFFQIETRMDDSTIQQAAEQGSKSFNGNIITVLVFSQDCVTYSNSPPVVDGTLLKTKYDVADLNHPSLKLKLVDPQSEFKRNLVAEIQKMSR